MKKIIWTKGLQKIFSKDPGNMLILVYSLIIMLFMVVGLFSQSL